MRILFRIAKRIFTKHLFRTATLGAAGLVLTAVLQSQLGQAAPVILGGIISIFVIRKLVRVRRLR